MTEQCRVLVDQHGPPTQFSIVEGEKAGPLVVEGKIAHAGKPTANGRVYSYEVLAEGVAALQPKIRMGALYAAVDHPGDGVTRILETGAIVRALNIRPNGEVVGRFEVVEELPGGHAVAALLRRGAAVGMSSRGYGGTTIGPDGHEHVSPGFKLKTWDFVADPACGDAYPKVVRESVEDGKKKLVVDPEEMTETELRALFPDLVRAIEEHAYRVASDTIDIVLDDSAENKQENAEQSVDLTKVRESLAAEVRAEVREAEAARLREDFAAKLADAMMGLRQEVEREVREALATDPETVGAKLTLKKVAETIAPMVALGDIDSDLLAERDAKLQELEQKVANLQVEVECKESAMAELTETARRLAYRMFVAEKIAGHPMQEKLRDLVGEVTADMTPDEVRKKVEAAIKAVDDIADVTEKTREEERREIEARYQEMLAKEREAAQAAVEAAKAEAEKARKQFEAVKNSLDQKMVEMERKIKLTIAEAEKRRLEAEKAKEEAEQKAAARAEQLAEAVAAAEQAALLAYAADRLVGHPQRAEIVEQVRRGNLTSMDEIDEAATAQEPISSSTEGILERIRSAFGRGVEDSSSVLAEGGQAAAPAPLPPEAREALRELHDIGIPIGDNE